MRKILPQLLRAGCGDSCVGTTSCNLSEATNAVCHHCLTELMNHSYFCCTATKLYHSKPWFWVPQMPSAKQAALGWVGTGPAQSAIVPQGRFEPYPQSSQRLPLTWIKRWGDRENLTLYDFKVCYSEKSQKQTNKKTLNTQIFIWLSSVKNLT